MSPVAVALNEFDTEEVTQVEDTGNWKPTRKRYPGDELIERIDLKAPDGSTVQVRGDNAIATTNRLLRTWAASLPLFFGRRPGDGVIEMTVCFGDGFRYTARPNLRTKTHRDVVRYLRDENNFRASICPDLKPREAAGIFSLFLTSYVFHSVR